jgi:hypothetical protein
MERETMKCPHCNRDLRAGKRIVVNGRTHHAEFELAVCPTHGKVFLTREGLPGAGRLTNNFGFLDFGFLPSNADDADGDVSVREPRPSPRKPLAGSAARPEPKEGADERT